MKTFRKSTLISSVALLLVAIVALSGATFAWFSSQAYAEASAIQATTSKASQLVLSASGQGEWKQSLPLNISKNLTPVTPTYEETEDGEGGTLPASIATSSWLKASAATWDSQVAATAYEPATANTDYVVQRIYVKYLGAEDATTKLNVELTVDADYSEDAAADFYRAAIVPVTDAKATATATGAAEYIYSVEAYDDRATTATYGDYATSTDTEFELGTITAETVYAYDVYVWFEGEDLDCIDSYYENDITLSLKFE